MVFSGVPLTIDEISSMVNHPSNKVRSALYSDQFGYNIIKSNRVGLTRVSVFSLSEPDIKSIHRRYTSC